jgi:hypothetical protein
MQFRSAHNPGDWMDLGVLVTGNGGTNCVADHIPFGESQCFYRVVELP